jgi:ribosomal protein S18 acetylase RimI-like enzyme
MKIIQRAYAGEIDKAEMSALAHHSPSDHSLSDHSWDVHLHPIDLPYRLSSWAFDYPENVGLWVNEVNESQQLIAWAVLQSPFWTIDYAWHPALAPADIHSTILDWADVKARQALNTPAGRPAWFVNVLASQTKRIANLERAGFANQANVDENPLSTVRLRRDAHHPIQVSILPEGFVIRPLAGAAEVDAYVELHQSVFESKNMTREWRQRIIQRPQYIPELDLVVVAPDGRLAAFCICWFDNKGFEGRPSGEIEPLGVDKVFRKLGLGKAILAEGIRRLHAQGAEQVYVETENFRNAALNLYESSGFAVQETIYVFRKDYEVQES